MIIAHVRGIENPRLQRTQRLSFEEDEYDSAEKFSFKSSKCWRHIDQSYLFFNVISSRKEV
ncbi:hypothetical protein PUN28_001785 [Cardiocondyla obscurior]|uniref:Uncharacterized protein n=1 Tax=Cardiocondyla obscurior TaxID=286306 RepID=A0AAW2GR92_9HYME